MNAMTVIAALLALTVLVYLIVALLAPERLS